MICINLMLSNTHTFTKLSCNTTEKQLNMSHKFIKEPKTFGI